MFNIIGFLTTVLILVTVHEWGHFFIARLLKVEVLRFSVGFGPVLWKREKKGVVYQLGLIPLGGFVQFVDDEKQKSCFNLQPAWKRLMIVLAGPFVNILLAFLLFLFLSTQNTHQLKAWIKLDTTAVENNQPVEMVDNQQLLAALDTAGAGLIVTIAGNPIRHWQDVQINFVAASLQSADHIGIEILIDEKLYTYSLDRKLLSSYIEQEKNILKELGVKVSLPLISPTINSVQKNSPAATAGLQSGDIILQINNENITNWNQFSTWVMQHPSETVKLLLERNGNIEVLIATVGDKVNAAGEIRGFMGVTAKYDNFTDEKFWYQQNTAPLELINVNLKKLWDIVTISFSSINQKVIQEGDIKQIAGPFTIAKLAGDNIQQGLYSFMAFLAFVSLSIGVFNLLPIPLLDGGQAILIMIEMVIRQKLPKLFQEIINRTGVVLVLGLMIIAVSSDFLRIF